MGPRCCWGTHNAGVGSGRPAIAEPQLVQFRSTKRFGCGSPKNFFCAVFCDHVLRAGRSDCIVGGSCCYHCQGMDHTSDAVCYKKKIRRGAQVWVVQKGRPVDHRCNADEVDAFTVTLRHPNFTVGGPNKCEVTLRGGLGLFFFQKRCSPLLQVAAQNSAVQGRALCPDRPLVRCPCCVPLRTLSLPELRWDQLRLGRIRLLLITF